MASPGFLNGQDRSSLKLAYLLLSPTLGMHQYTADLANRMAARHDVHLVTIKGFPRDRYSPMVEAHAPVALKTSGFSSESVALGPLRQVKQALDRIRPDMVHFTGPHPWNVELLRWLGQKGIPTLHTLHDLEPHPGTRYGWLLHLWNSLVVRHADHILVHGRFYRQRLVSKGLPEGSVSFTPILHLFLSSARIADLEKTPPQIQYQPWILFFGRLEEYKGIETLLDAYRLLGDDGRYSEPVRPGLVIASSASEPKWGQLAGMDVVWRCPLKDDREAEKLFRDCALLVLPYLQASQSALIAAAYYFRKPVVVSRAGALAEYVEDGQTGLLVPPGDPQALAYALSRMLRSRTTLEMMGKAGRRWYDRWRVQETATLFELYEKVAVRGSQNAA